MLRTLLSGISAIALLSACSGEDDAGPSTEASTSTAQQPTSDTQQVDAEQNESERLYAWLDEVWDAELEFSPQMKAYLGVIDEDYSR